MQRLLTVFCSQRSAEDTLSKLSGCQALRKLTVNACLGRLVKVVGTYQDPDKNCMRGACGKTCVHTLSREVLGAFGPISVDAPQDQRRNPVKPN